MSLGPVELIVLHFEGNAFRQEVLPVLQQLVDDGTVRILDLLFEVKDQDGRLSVAETDEVREAFGEFQPLIAELTELLTEDDAERLGGSLAPNSSAALILFEDCWANRFRDAVQTAGGRLVVSERIPRAVIDELIAARSASLAAPAPA